MAMYLAITVADLPLAARISAIFAPWRTAPRSGGSPAGSDERSPPNAGLLLNLGELQPPQVQLDHSALCEMRWLVSRIWPRVGTATPLARHAADPVSPSPSK